MPGAGRGFCRGLLDFGIECDMVGASVEQGGRERRYMKHRIQHLESRIQKPTAVGETPATWTVALLKRWEKATREKPGSGKRWSGMVVFYWFLAAFPTTSHDFPAFPTFSHLIF